MLVVNIGYEEQNYKDVDLMRRAILTCSVFVSFSSAFAHPNATIWESEAELAGNFSRGIGW